MWSGRLSFWPQLLLAANAVLGTALLESPSSPRSASVSLVSRADVEIGNPVLNDKCVYLCDVSNGCGNDFCSIFGKRDEPALPVSQPLNYLLWNETAQTDVQVSAKEYATIISARSQKVKRAWNYEPRWNKGRIATYLSQQASESPDAQFGDMRGLFAGGVSMATVSDQAEFSSSSAFQMGSGGLHGCTVLAIASLRGAYMAHYWEVYALNKDDDLSAGSAGLANFQTKVANTLTGQGDIDSPTMGPPVNWNLFNRDGDNTRIFIMSPFADGFRPSSSNYKTRMEDLMYPNKVRAIINLLTEQGRIPGAAPIVQGYQRLNYSYDRQRGQYVGPDASKINTSERGIACLQYDGDSHYRLFIEHMIYQDTDKVAG